MKCVSMLMGLCVAVLLCAPIMARDLTPVPADPGIQLTPAPAHGFDAALGPAVGQPQEVPMVQPYSTPIGQPYSPSPPVEHAYGPPTGGYIDSGPTYIESPPVPLFTRVRYVDLREKHPCAVTKIIRVNDPTVCNDACSLNCRRSVYIAICVPPDCFENVTCRRDGDRLRYDYGKYAVDVRIKRGYIVVDYQK